MKYVEIEETPLLQRGLNELEAVWRYNPRFFDLMVEMARRHNTKGHDYCGQGKDPLANLRASEEFGIPAWKGVLLRMNDKWMRIRNFANREVLQVADESYEDTHLDSAVYHLHAVLLYRDVKAGP